MGSGKNHQLAGCFFSFFHQGYVGVVLAPRLEAAEIGGKTCNFFVYTLELPPTQDASHHQDAIPFLVGNPYKPSFVTVTGWGVDLMYTK